MGSRFCGISFVSYGSYKSRLLIIKIARKGIGISTMAMNMDMSRLLMGTDDRMLSVCLFLLRCTAGIILFVAGASKVMGWFGGMGMETTVQNFAKSGISPFLAYVSSYTEFIGGALLRWHSPS